ncbi:M48 family metalloprotease [Phenylobacterium sp.]|uniref:M48 family metalloprotease n=1 Tax=Phenylobacterium sp. TaxID=1871053 RepID=UPI0025D6EF9C|nr:M48 family metalloprotease [Phenylobacterium sp.]
MAAPHSSLGRDVVHSPLLKLAKPNPFRPTAEEYEGHPTIVVPALTAKLQGITRRLEAAAGWPEGTVQIQVGDCAGYSASATAPNTVSVCRDAVLFAKTEDELAWLIGHEIGHLHLQHKVIEPGIVLKDGPAEVAWGVVAVGLLIAAPPAILAMPAGHRETRRAMATSEGSYSRNSELAADVFGTRLIIAAGYSPLGAAAALSCLEYQTTDCSPDANTIPAPATEGHADIFELLSGSAYFKSPTHPAFRQRKAGLEATVRRFKGEFRAPTDLVWETPSERGEVDAYRHLSLAADDVSRDAQAVFIDSMRSQRRDVARREACAKRDLSGKTHHLLQMDPMGDRDILELAATVGLICGDRSLAFSLAKAQAPSYLQSLSHMLILSQFNEWSAYDNVLFRLARTHASDEQRYRELRLIAEDVYPQKGSGAAQAGCRASPRLIAKARTNTGFLSGTPESQVFYYCVPSVADDPDFMPVDNIAILWFRSDPNAIREDSVIAMNYRVNKAFQEIIEQGYVDAGRPDHAFCPAGLEYCFGRR